MTAGFARTTRENAGRSAPGNARRDSSASRRAISTSRRVLTARRATLSLDPSAAVLERGSVDRQRAAAQRQPNEKRDEECGHHSPRAQCEGMPERDPLPALDHPGREEAEAENPRLF